MRVRLGLSIFSVFAATLAAILAPSTHADVSADLSSKLTAAGLSANAIEILDQEMHKTGYSKPSAGIVDYTLPSDQPRFFVINLNEETFKVYHVAHGTKSGGQLATAFSNALGSNMSSLGFLRTGEIYSGKFGRAMALTGFSASNSNVGRRGIMLHSAEYSSPEFFKKYDFWGRSFGCLAVEQQEIDAVINSLGTGALLLAYHDSLWQDAQSHPTGQTLPNSEIAPTATVWEHLENSQGDPSPHHEGSAPTSYYKKKYGAD